MLRRSSRSCWGGSGVSFGRLDEETPHESLLPNCFLHCREYRSWLTGLVIRTWWRWKRSGLKIGWSFYETYFDWRKRKDRRTGSKGIGGCWPGDSQGRAQIRRFSSRDREPRKCQEALSSRRLV